MGDDVRTPDAPAPLTRRSFGVLGGATALGLLAAAAHPGAVRAANGDPFKAGYSLASTRTTSLSASGAAGSGFHGKGPVGVRGRTTGTASSAAGIYGKSSAASNYGVLSNGKFGVSGAVEFTQGTITTFGNPPTGALQLFTRVNASNKIEFCIRTSGGSVSIVATEP